MANRYTLKDIPNLKERDIFLDANILIYLFWPTGSSWAVDTYSKYFATLVRQKIKLHIDFNVISEFINRTVRLEYDKYVSINKLDKRSFSFKSYRDSPEGIESMEDIYTTVESNILSKAQVCGKVLGQKEILDFLVIDSLDFVDKAILSVCQEREFVILTNDADYAKCDIDILTANSKILR